MKNQIDFMEVCVWYVDFSTFIPLRYYCKISDQIYLFTANLYVPLHWPKGPKPVWKLQGWQNGHSFHMWRTPFGFCYITGLEECDVQIQHSNGRQMNTHWWNQEILAFIYLSAQKSWKVMCKLKKFIWKISLNECW